MNGRQVQGSGDGKMANLVAQLWEIFTSERFKVYRYRNVAAGVASLYILRKVFSILTTLWSHSRAYVLAPYGIFRTNLKNYGSWAVVTGASEGIGKGYATELARRGLNVVIMSRSLEKLQSVADEIKAKYGVEVMVIAVDFSSGQEIYPQLSEQLQNLDIGVLVNNVGLCYEYPDYFLNVSEQRFRNMIELNCQSMIQMTHMLLPKMVEKKRGVVINISTGATFPMPLYNVYSASKVFVNYFSEALGREYASKGIVVQTIMPLGVATAMSGIRRTSFFIPSPTAFSRSALNTVGILSVTPGCYPHVLQATILLQLLPRRLADYFFQSALKTTRQKALLKKAAQKKEE